MNDCIEAIILKQQDYRERDVLLTVLSKEYGKLSFVANGARKITSKNASRIFPYSVVKIYFDYMPGKTMFRLRTSEMVAMHRHIHEDLLKSAAGALMCEMIDALTMSQQGQLLAEYTLLQQGLAQLDANNDVETILSLYIADILNLFGSGPDVEECTICQKKIVRALSVKAGGFLCEEHAAKMDVPYASPTDLKRFRLLCKATLQRIDLVRQTTEATMEDVCILVDFFQTYTGIQLRSFTFFTSVLQLNNVT